MPEIAAVPPAGEARRRSKDQIAALQKDWRQRWPAVFGKPVPLAIGTAREIRKELGPTVPRALVGIAIHRWTMQSAYLRALARGDERRTLDGSPAGIPDEAQRQEARRLLEERAAKHARDEERVRQRREAALQGEPSATVGS